MTGEATPWVSPPKPPGMKVLSEEGMDFAALPTPKKPYWGKKPTPTDLASKVLKGSAGKQTSLFDLLKKG